MGLCHEPNPPIASRLQGKGLHWFGLGLAGQPTRGLIKLQRLLNKNAFWAKDRSLSELKTLLRHSSGVESVAG